METGRSIDVGQGVRRLREHNGISVRTLAAKCGFSASFISQVENGQSSPSIASLERIAAALGVTLVEFFQSCAPQTPAIVRSAHRPEITSGWSRATMELLGAGPVLEPLLITLASGGMSSKSPTAPVSHQFALVLEGTITLFMEDAVEVLTRGDAVTITPGTRHRWQNASEADATILLVSIRPTR